MKKIYSKTFGRDVEVEEKSWELAKQHVKHDNERAILLALDIDIYAVRQVGGKVNELVDSLNAIFKQITNRPII